MLREPPAATDKEILRTHDSGYLSWGGSGELCGRKFAESGFRRRRKWPSARGEGYCVFNEGAIAALAMQTEGRVRRVAILDCDVHRGNGTESNLGR